MVVRTWSTTPPCDSNPSVGRCTPRVNESSPWGGRQHDHHDAFNGLAPFRVRAFGASRGSVGRVVIGDFPVLHPHTLTGHGTHQPRQVIEVARQTIHRWTITVSPSRTNSSSSSGWACDVVAQDFVGAGDLDSTSNSSGRRTVFWSTVLTLGSGMGDLTTAEAHSEALRRHRLQPSPLGIGQIRPPRHRYAGHEVSGTIQVCLVANPIPETSPHTPTRPTTPTETLMGWHRCAVPPHRLPSRQNPAARTARHQLAERVQGNRFAMLSLGNNWAHKDD